MSLISLVYVSFATQKMTQDDLIELLRVARENNAQKGITGMLLYRDGFFIQVLEGETEVVMPLYEKIVQDERHEGVLQVYNMPIAERQFEQWSMGFNMIADDDLKDMPGFIDIFNNPDDNAALENCKDEAHRLLISFRDRTYF